MTVEAAQRAPRGDVAAHRARADDVNPVKAPVLRRKIAQRSRSSNTPHEIAGRRRDEEGADRPASARNAAAPCPPYRNQSVTMAYGAG